MKRALRLLLVLGLATTAFAESPEPPANFLSRIQVTSVTYEDGAGGELRSPSGIFYDTHSAELLVAATGSSRITIYDQNLVAKFSVVHFVPDSLNGRMIMGEPRSVATLSSGDIIVIDNLARFVDLLDFRGAPVMRLQPSELAGDKTLKLRATAIAVDEHDNIYLSVTGDLESVLMLDSDFKLIRKIGKKGQEAADFSTILSLCVSQGKLYVADLYAFPAIKVFDTTGTFLTGWAGHAQESKDLSMPTGIAVVQDTLGTPIVLVSDALRHTIKAYSETGDLISMIGGYGAGIGEWQYPSGLAFSTNNTFFVLERGTGRVQKVEIRPPK